MNSVDKRIEELLNRAGQTISDLPKGYLLNVGEAKTVQGVACRWFIGEDAPEGVALRNLVSIPLYQYILHLTDIIDRMEWALENVLNLKDRHVHIVSNVDAPEGLTQEQYFKAAEAIIDATKKYRVDLEPWDDWSVGEE